MSQLEFIQNPEQPNRPTQFADVILPIPIPQLFTYRIPTDWEDLVEVGVRVIVQFGKRRIITGIVGKIHQKPPEKYQAKYLLEVLDDTPTVQELHIRFWQWMADYYLCNIGEVMNGAIPSGLKLSSQSRIQLNPEFDLDDDELDFSDKELVLLEALRNDQSLSYPEAAQILEVKSIYQTLKYLIAKRAIIIYEEIKEKYKPKKVKKVRLNPQYANSDDAIEALFKKLSKRPKQETVLLKYLSLVPIYANRNLNAQGIEKSKLLNEDTGEISTSAFNTLLKHDIFEQIEQIVSRLAEYDDQVAQLQIPDIKLSEAQQEARDKILKSFEQKDIALLRGVTGSGKTEIYIDLIQKVVESGAQVLMLLPEIALTTQIVVRLKKAFGNKIGIYHSKFSDNERVEVWKGVANGDFPFVIGVRSSLFLPFDNLGLVIVDEEHETSYKQYDPAPRYHARDAAMMLAKMHQAKVLLGSATPSIESYHRANQGVYGLVELLERYGNAKLPDIILVDTRKAKQTGKMRNEFAPSLLEEIENRLAQKEQIILFQNRRGYAPYITCEDCGWTPECHQCAVNLTYHMYRNELRCHYCGHKEGSPRVCSACGSTKLKMVGLGTEKIEDELKLLLPEARIQRMDLDTTRKKYSYQKIISAFENHEVDILVGTQMVTKGLDFDKVSLVGVFDVDRLMYFPDFRAHERTFQLITQVSGRAGRRERKGMVMIQTANPEQPLLHKITSYDYEGLYREEVQERQRYGYPPFTRLIRLTIKTQDKSLRDAAAEALAQNLRMKIGNKRVLGPEYPVIDKIRNFFLKDILIKIERNNPNLRIAKKLIREEITLLITTKAFKKVEVVVDVDFL
ncbi:MAG: replication restart helicase PriA [Flammeovirgaceae bacterium]